MSSDSGLCESQTLSQSIIPGTPRDVVQDTEDEEEEEEENHQEKEKVDKRRGEQDQIDRGTTSPAPAPPATSDEAGEDPLALHENSETRPPTVEADQAEQV